MPQNKITTIKEDINKLNKKNNFNLTKKRRYQ
jgi:hypothetical protein